MEQMISLWRSTSASDVEGTRRNNSASRGRTFLQVCRTNKSAERARAFSQDRVRQSAVDQIAQGCADDVVLGLQNFTEILRRWSFQSTFTSGDYTLATALGILTAAWAGSQLAVQRREVLGRAL